MDVHVSSEAPTNGIPEIRQDLTTGEWVIIAPARAQRPHAFMTPHHGSVPRFDAACPFCPGREAQTPPPVAVVPTVDNPTQWALRVVPNKFPALLSHGASYHNRMPRFFPAVAGVGHHEVVIDSPDHNGYLPDLPLAQITLLLRTWRDRFAVLRLDPQVRLISIFKNHGERAGASLPHPHTQILALPVISAAMQTRFATAQHYHAIHQRCLHCDLLNAELADGRRIVCENPGYVAYQPYAARFPFETWIVPRQHQACFGDSSDATLAECACLLQEFIRRLVLTLQAPAYNLILHTILREENDNAYHWFIQIIPRLLQIAGFELGAGMAINPVPPEETAEPLRRAL